jgi:hypothetical protein
VYPGKNTPGTACIDQSLALLNVPFRPKSAFRERQLSARSGRSWMSALERTKPLTNEFFDAKLTSRVSIGKISLIYAGQKLEGRAIAT